MENEFIKEREHSREEYEDLSRHSFRMAQENDRWLSEWAKELDMEYESYTDLITRVGLRGYYEDLFAKVGETL